MSEDGCRDGRIVADAHAAVGWVLAGNRVWLTTWHGCQVPPSWSLERSDAE